MDSHARIRSLFEAAIDLPRPMRAGFVQAACQGDERMQREVERLVEAYENNVETTGPETGAPDAPRGRFGPYEIARELGHGGMGTVYLARRTDGAFDRLVAIKVIRGNAHVGAMFERFNRERRLLASMNHPGIATLYDAGSTPEGNPYFVMEYVDGMDVTEYADRHRLSVARRVALFQQVCGAVAAAHAIRVVHCDLKPSNILVDVEGRPRVLDFGVAIAFTKGGQEAEPALEPAGSPRYASPEQLRGESIQTTSDVYSLGVVLHELLIGTAPMRAADGGPELPSRLVRDNAFTTGTVQSNPIDVAARRASTPAQLRGSIDGDLDAILVKCLQPSPERRYESVEALRADLQNYLEHRPVTARQPTAGYLASRFARRHRTLVAAGSLVALVIILALVSVTYLWRRAEQARAEAAHRYAEVRTLARSLFEVDAALGDAASAIDARQRIVQNAVRSLDRLSAADSQDGSVALELAEGYWRVGNMLGNPNMANLGRRSDALDNYDKAAERAARALAAAPHDRAARVMRARIEASRADVLLAKRDYPAARTAYQRSMETAQALLTEEPEDGQLLQLIAGVYRPLGDVHLAENNPQAALTLFENARRADLALVAREPNSGEAKRLLALTQLRFAEASAAVGRRADAVAAYEEAVQLLQGSADAAPTGRSARDLAVGRMKLGQLLHAQQDARGRLELEKALAIYRRLAAADPRDARAQRDLLVGLVAYADALDPNNPSAAPLYAEALRIAERLAVTPLDDARTERDLKVVLARLTSRREARDTQPRLECALLRQGREIPFDKHAPIAAVGDDLRVRLDGGSQGAQYLLVMGGTGPARLVTRDDVSAAGWKITMSGPPPSETILLLEAPRPLTEAERSSLLDRVGGIQGPRNVPEDAHLLWRTGEPELLDSTATARGGAPPQWPEAVREALKIIPGLKYTGRTFPVTINRAADDRRQGVDR